ncbi:MAG TPA: T9SS type A sorting domain-containing protein [Bacteroidota bacterium]|nr:T9SS type A sorting domain-containing protein [Bacteroidota bacterium]
MKSTAFALVVALALALPAPGLAQIPNAGFESWTGLNPTGWFTTNIVGFDTTIVPTTSVHGGSFALQGTVKSFMNLVSYAPIAWSEFSIAQRYKTFSGWYTFSAVGGDSLYGWCVVQKSGSPLGYAFFANKTTRGSYTQFSVDLSYIAVGTPDSAQIWFGITGSSANNDTIHVGSTFKLDDLTLTGTAAGIEPVPGAPLTYTLAQNYPNPFNPSTSISYQLKSAGPVKLGVYDILGREVAMLVDGIQGAGAHEMKFDGSGLASGVYIYRLQAGTFIEQKKMVLAK